MDHGPLVMDEIEAGANLIREFSQQIPVKVAFWLRASEDDFRYFYLSSDQIAHGHLGQAAEVLHQITRRRRSLFLDPFRVNLLPGDDRFAMAAAELNARFPDELGHRLGSQPFGGSFIADGSIYPATMVPGFPRVFA